MEVSMLTTIDNPHNPFTDWDAWEDWDRKHGHNSCAYLARISKTSSELSEEEYVKANNDAIDEICRLNVLGKWRKVTDTVEL